MYKFFVVLISLTFFGCNNSKTSKNVSNATGWTINSRDGGFQYNTNYKGKKQDLDWYLLKEELTLKVKFKMMLCMIGIIPQISNT